LVEKIIIATSPNTPETCEYIGQFDYDVLDTPGVDFVHDLGFILDYFESKSCDDILLFINADLPFISSQTIDEVITHYLNSDKDALSVLVPVEVFDDLGLEYSYDFEGKVPSGLNILRSENIIQDENQLVLAKVELALNINTIPDSEIAEKLYHEYYI
jgi:adenosylcobinamide-phosphate guanylyltransferase